MDNTDYKQAANTMLTAIFRNEFGDEITQDDWALTDEELIEAIGHHKSRNDGAVVLSFDELVADCYKIDDKTNRPMTQGFVCYNGEAHFAKEEDALAWLNRDEPTYSTWEEACNDTLGAEWECYYTEWH